MSRLAAVFSRRRHKALIAYVTAGYPSLTATEEIVPALIGAGCDIVELGIPFSDPLADGATIQQASYRALQNGVTPKLCLEVAARLRQKTPAPLLFMTYYNPVLHFGLKGFCREAAGAGIDGLIIPDLPPEEGTALEALTRQNGLDLVYMLAPTSNDERIRIVAEHARGFIYLVSVAGVTGARSALPTDLEAFVARVRRIASQPLCVGFGIATPEQAKRVATVADGVIIGSRILQLLETGVGTQALTSFIESIRRSLDE